jgi:hypothetical protein
MTAFLFVLFLLVVAGLVSAAGDRMGHLAARRKIRFGNMRPRNVSTTIAVVTGLLISLVTFLILFALWKDFRDALTQHQAVRQDLTVARRQLDQASDDLRTAQEQTQQAVDDKALVEQELADLEQEASDLRGLVTAAAIELDEKNQLVAQRGREISQLTTRKQKLEEDISGYESVEGTLREVVGLTRAELEAYKHEKIILARGTRLFYLTIGASEAGQLGPRLTAALVRLSDQLADEGLRLDPASSDELELFVEQYPYKQVEHETVVVLSTANNVLQGGEVAVAIRAVPLVPLVKTSDEIMTVLVENREASISWRGQNIGTVEVAAQFDEASFATFIEQLWAVFTAESAEMGFLPDLDTGEIPNPIERLVSIYEDLSVRDRPFLLQVVAGSPAHALDGLDDCDIYVSKWPPEN